MSATVLFELARAVAASCTAALATLDVTVSDGPAITLNAGDYLEVGCAAPRPTGPVEMGSAAQDWRTTGRTRTETGELNLVVSSWRNDGPVTLSRDKAEVVLDAIASLILDDPRWGVDSVTATSIARIAPIVATTGSASGTALLIVLSYSARLTRESS